MNKILVTFCLSWVLVLVPTTGQTEGVNKSAGVRISQKWVESAKKALPDIIDQHGQAIKAAGKKYDVPPEIIAAIVATEVAGNEKNPEVTSSAGAVGPMQVTPIAQERVENLFGFECDTKIPKCNFRTGVAYIRSVCDELPGCTKVGRHLSYVAVGYVDGPSAARWRMRTKKGTSGHQYVQKVKCALKMVQELALL